MHRSPQGPCLPDVQFRGQWADEYFYAILEEEWRAQADPQPAD